MVSDQPRTRPPAITGLSYHTASYWETRFSTDPREQFGFEWLSPSTTLLSLLTPSLLSRTPPPRILHIGVGTSNLSLDIVRHLRETGYDDWKDRAERIVNVDFAERSVEFQRQAEKKFLEETGEEHEGDLMRYEVVDLMDWAQVAGLGKGELFDVVLDKSTTDSISTGEDVPFTSLLQSQTAHPAMAHLSKQRQGLDVRGVAATQMLGTHLGAIVKPGGVWLCHSYSSDRWDDVIPAIKEEGTDEAWPWKEVSRTPVPVQSLDPNAPQIHHYIYTMQRR